MLAVILMAACAQVRSISGGEKDTRPPQLLRAEPPSLSTHFAATRIVLTFDEYVQLNDIGRELIVSPTMAQPPRIKVSGKSVVVELKSAPAANTTYTLNFGNGIADLNEGNKASEFTYVFTTGAVIDSLRITGTATHAWQSSALPGARIMLFADSMLGKKITGKPQYVTRSRDDGSFRFDYLPAGRFALVAAEDGNSNYQPDEGELMAFCEKLIVPADTAYQSLRFFKTPPSRPHFASFISDSCGSLIVPWHETFDTALLNAHVPAFPGTKVFKELTLNGDSLAIITGLVRPDKMEVILTYDTLPADTLYMPASTRKSSAPFRLSLRQGNSSMPGQPLSLGTSRAARWDGPIDLYIDQVPLKTVAETQYSFQHKLQAPLAPGKHTLLIPPGALYAADGSTNDTLRTTWQVAAAEDLAQLQLRFANWPEDERYMLQLDNKQNEPVMRVPIKPGAVIDLRDLWPGQYTLRLWIDEDDDGRWTSGNYSKMIQPERLWVYGSTLTLRANWLMQITWAYE